MKKIYLTMLFVVLPTFLFAQLNWEVLNPKPSYHTAVSMHFFTPQHGLILNNRHLLETNDAGNNWHIKHNVMEANVMAFKDDIGIIAGDNGYLLQSLDGGETWSGINTNSDFYYNSISIIDANTFILSSDYHVSTTNDRGLTWTTHFIPTNGQVNKTIFFDALVGIAFSRNGNILKTTDGGETWVTKIENFSSQHDYFTGYFLDDQIGFSTNDWDSIYKTTDGGETWTTIPGNFHSINAFFFVNENLGYACGEYGTLYKTLDGGLTWNETTLQPGYYYGTDLFALYFTDADKGFMAGMKGIIAKTVNGGNSMSTYATTYADIDKLQFTTTQTGYALAADRLYRTNDAGNNWTDFGTPQTNADIVDIDFVSPTTAYAFGGSNGINNLNEIYKTIDGGNTWTTLAPVSNIFHNSFYCVDFINENIGVVSGGFNSPSTWRTVDGGATWTQVNSTAFHKVQFVTDQIGYAMNIHTRTIYKSTNAGLGWSPVFVTDAWINDFDFSDANNGFVAGDNAAMFKTENGGGNWATVTIPYGHYEKIKLYNAAIIYASDTSVGNFYRSIDSGATWELLSKFYTIESIVFHNDAIYLAGSNGKILRSNISFLGTTKPIATRNQVQIYPNPTAGRLHLKTNNKLSIAATTIYTFTGQMLWQQSFDGKMQDIEIDLSGKEKGLYFIKIDLGDGTNLTQKLILE